MTVFTSTRAGAGAALAMLIADQALAILGDMATFSSAEVSDRGA